MTREPWSRARESVAVWQPADEQRWEAYHIDDEPPDVVFVCPECAEREFKS
jgi:hypothetical protein